jgi:Na+/phosphate symporter
MATQAVTEKRMTDKISLGFVGYVFGAVTAAVIVVAALVVTAHVNGRMAIDDGRASVISASISAPAISAVKKASGQEAND